MKTKEGMKKEKTEISLSWSRWTEDKEEKLKDGNRTARWNYGSSKAKNECKEIRRKETEEIKRKVKK